jgi:acyl-CoA thioesterase-2
MSSSTRFQKLMHRLQLEEESPGIFVGGAGEGAVGREQRLFGGLVAAQAEMATQNTVEGFAMHSLHAYFLRPGRASREIAYHVTEIKNGRNFVARQVEARQGGDSIFLMTASFQRPGSGPSHQPTMPVARPPEDCPNRDQLRGRPHWQDMPVDVRMITEPTGDEPLPAEQQAWLRANGKVPDDPRIHLALIVYASDRTLLETAYRPHVDSGAMAGASLDHAMWFHGAPRFDGWLLYHTRSPAAANGRGLATGTIFDAAGRCLATVAQEGTLSFS